jgi:hypothetical protein
VTELTTVRRRTTLIPGRAHDPGATAELVANDQGDVILGWLTRVLVTFTLVAAVGFDGLSIGVAHVGASADADTAARAASQAWLSNGGNAPETLVAAEQAISQHGETLVAGSLIVATNGTAHLEVRREASTVLVRRLGPLKSWADVVVKGSGLYTGSS